VTAREDIASVAGQLAPSVVVGPVALLCRRSSAFNGIDQVARVGLAPLTIRELDDLDLELAPV
jgi:hypothetical protein